jgi:hypothetical protein
MTQLYKFNDDNGVTRLEARQVPDPIPEAGTLVPVANAAGVTVDTTTYSDTIAGGGAKLTTLVFPGDQGALAIAISGDSFPRYVIASDPHNDGIYMGNGTYNPVSDGVEMFLSGTGNLKLLSASGGSIVLGANASVLNNGEGDFTKVVAANGFSGNPVTSGALPTVALSSGVAGQVSTTRNASLVVPFTGDATNNAATLKIELSPDNSTFSTLDTLSIAAALNTIGALNVPVSLTVPTAWYVKLTAVHGTIGTGTYY